MHCKIITAYSYAPKYGVYTVAAYVLESDFPGLPRGTTYHMLNSLAIDEDRALATDQAIQAIYKDNVRHPAGMDIECRGRVSRDRVTGFYF